MKFLQNLFRSFTRKTGLSARRCPACGRIMTGRGGPLCPECAAAIPLRTGGYCPTCGAMSGRDDDPPMRCSECRTAPPPWDALLFHGQYTGLLRDLILAYKFNNNFGRNHLLSDLARRTFQFRGTRIPDVIVPVPLHTRRLLWRGFNQSVELSRTLGKGLDRPVLKNGLTRVRNTRPQTRLGHKERQQNIKNAFAARRSEIEGRTALLVDDVYTTGATLRECSRTLIKAGAAGVDVLVLARTQQG